MGCRHENGRLAVAKKQQQGNTNESDQNGRMKNVVPLVYDLYSVFTSCRACEVACHIEDYIAKQMDQEK